MGSQPGEFVPGVSCTACEDDIWEVAETPKYVALTLNAVVAQGSLPLPAFNDVAAIMRQIFGSPCNFTCILHIATIVVLFQWQASDLQDESAFLVRLPDYNKNMFTSYDTPECTIHADNENRAPPPPANAYFHGTATITWGPDINKEAFDEQQEEYS